MATEIELNETHVGHVNKGFQDDIDVTLSEPCNDFKEKDITPHSWDMFPKTSVKDHGTYQTYWKFAERLLTVVFITFLFFTVIGSGLLSRITLHLIIWHLHPPASNYPNSSSATNYIVDSSAVNNSSDSGASGVGALDEKWIWTTFIVMITPYCISSIYCLKTICLKKTRSLHARPLIAILVIETLHSVALVCLVFIVLPVFNAPTASVIYLSTLAVLPVLKMLYFDSEQRNKCCSSIIQIIALVLQLGGIGCICFYMYRKDMSENSIIILSVFVVSSVFVSFKYWENFVCASDDSKQWFPYLKFIYQTRRTKMMLVVNVWKIVISFVAVICIYAIKAENPYRGVRAVFNLGTSMFYSGFGGLEFGSVDSCNTYVPYVITVVNIASSYVCSKSAKTACVIGCQRLCFAVPLFFVTLATPFVLTGLMYKSEILKFSSCDIYFAYLKLDEFEEIENSWPIVASFGLLYLSLICAAFYSWTTNGFILGATKRLFIRPTYCGIHTELSLLLNRRHNDDEYDLGIQMDRGRVYREDEIPKTSNKTIPMIYACATMWHETEKEMTQLLQSIFRMDRHQHMHRKAREGSKHGISPNGDVIDYDFEVHIFFDDAFITSADGNTCVNSYVDQLVRVMEFAPSGVYGVPIAMEPYERTDTPYGEKLTWKMFGGNSLVVHLKDKSKIRHRKRWSQVMYMYYFLGHQLKKCEKSVEEMIKRASRTYLLALDGDIDFQPEAVMHLVRRLLKNPEVGAACGRIHPTGNGPLVWYQKFEYAVSHWLQKATEHVTGCVLCSPGCFSLFRGSAIMEVIKTYTTRATEARHFIQYDQGEDRWLCTLLLKQGYRVEYVAESDSYTFAPEGFKEFYNQRRRWTPSTMANCLDLLCDWRNVVSKNSSVSRFFMLYQLMFFISSLLTPGTIFLMIVGAIITGFPDVPPWLSLTLNVIPVGIFMLSCIFAKEKTQLLFAGVLSAVYAIVMVLVLVGIIKEAVEDGLCSTTTIFLCFVVGVFFVTAILHPKEISSIMHGILYFLCVPSMSMLLMLYSLGNLHIVSWGTREVKAEPEADKTKQAKDSVLRQTGYTVSVGKFFRCICCPSDEIQNENRSLNEILNRLDRIEDGSTKHEVVYLTENKENDDLTSTDAAQHDQVELSHCKQKQDMKDSRLKESESEFWKELIEHYLKPLDKDMEKEKQIKSELISLRNKCCLFFFLLNTLLVTLIYALTQASAYSGSLNITLACSKDNITIEPISITFTVVFGILLAIQFICVIFHRIATLIHVVATTSFKDDDDRYTKLLTSLHILQKWGSRDSLKSATSVNTDDLEFDFDYRNKRQLMKAMETCSNQRPKTLDDIVKYNLEKLRTDTVESSDGRRRGSDRYKFFGKLSKTDVHALESSLSFIQNFENYNQQEKLYY